MILIQALISIILFPVALVIWMHFNLYHCLNAWQISMGFFCVLNVIISFWEIGLSLHIDYIAAEYKKLKEKYKNSRWNALVAFFNKPTKFADVFSLKYWTIVWSTYSIYDPSYANKESFGFFVDVGNGWTTLVPTLIFLFSMTFDFLSPRVVGFISILVFYQELYGTIIYILSFTLNNRHHTISLVESIFFIGLSNGLWVVFPAIGMYLSVGLILSDSYLVFRQ